MNAVDRRLSTRARPAFDTLCYYRGAIALVCDMSITGVGLMASAPPECGSIVQVELANDDTSLVISLRVVRVNRMETGDFFVGAQFVRPLTESEVTPFVTPMADLLCASSPHG